MGRLVDAGVTEFVDVVVIGAGQAGLSAAYHLRRTGFANHRDGGGDGFVVLDHAERAGGAWQYRWPTLTMDRVHGIHELPGMTFEPGEGHRRASEVLPGYFAEYERRFGLPVRRPVDVVEVREGEDERLLVRTTTGDWAARAVINATGTWDHPFLPRYPGAETFRGTQLHTADYSGPHAFQDKRVIVVGGGTSAVQQLLEIAPVAADTTWVTRRPPEFRAEPFTREYGREAVAEVDARVRAGLPPTSVVGVTGLPLTPEMAAARASGVLDRLPMFDRITADGAVWSDGTRRQADVILWATGFRAALGHLAPLRIREPGGGITMDGTEVVAEPRLHLVGYGPSASTIGANRAGRTAVTAIRNSLFAEPVAV